MKEIAVLETWDTMQYHLRLVTDGDRIWVEYRNILTGVEFWREDEYFPIAHDETVNSLLPIFLP
jgi:hypothetical protein